MDTSQEGFTLIELMIIVAILGFLVTIALPAYQDYIVRTKVSEVIVFADSARTNLSEYYMSSGRMPGAAEQANVNMSEDQSQFIGLIALSTTVSSVTITYTLANLSIAGDIALVGTATGDGIEWSCNTAATTVGSRYLPKNCRS
jgi:type IV pilus assembly protein PilA